MNKYGSLRYLPIASRWNDSMTGIVKSLILWLLMMFMFVSNLVAEEHIRFLKNKPLILQTPLADTFSEGVTIIVEKGKKKGLIRTIDMGSVKLVKEIEDEYIFRDIFNLKPRC